MACATMIQGKLWPTNPKFKLWPMQLWGGFFPFFFFLRNRLATNNVYMDVEVGLMHLARGITFRVEVVSDCQWGVLNFSTWACLLASFNGGWRVDEGGNAVQT